MKRSITLVLGIAFALASSAGAAVHRFYEGPPKPAAEIAVLRGDHFNLVSVDRRWHMSSQRGGAPAHE